MGKRLKQARLAARLTRKQLADRAGIKPAAIFEIEAGRTKVPAFDRVMLLAAALNVEPLWLCPVPALEHVIRVTQ